jgi:hypothetical protein
MRIAIAITCSTILVGSAIALADLENQQRGGEAGVFTSKPDGLRLLVPRGWFATDQASYPGELLWMMHPQPEAHIVLTAQPFTRALYCSWPIPCRTGHDALQDKLACALQSSLKAQHLRVGPIEAGPKENEEAGMPSVWFEYDDGKRFLRQAVALTEDRVISLVLSTGSTEARTSYVRAFEQALRTLQRVEPEAPAGSAAAPSDAGATTTAPAAVENPVGPCPAR